VNECVVVGRVMEVPEIRKTAKGNVVASMLVESDRNFRDEDGTIGTDVFNITLWRGEAEQARSVLKPGSMIAVRGRLCSKKISFWTLFEFVGYSEKPLKTGVFPIN